MSFCQGATFRSIQPTSAVNATADTVKGALIKSYLSFRARNLLRQLKIKIPHRLTAVRNDSYSLMIFLLNFAMFKMYKKTELIPKGVRERMYEDKEL